MREPAWLQKHDGQTLLVRFWPILWYKQLPECILPKKSTTGKYSYTKRDAKDRVVEVLLREKGFYVKKTTDGVLLVILDWYI